MSAEHEKDPAAALKRPRGADGGLEPAAQLGSPDKKKRKSGAQGASFPAPPSEFAPPPNPSSDHLIAANPFDDSYAAAAAAAAAAPYKPAGSPYFAGPGYPGFGGYNAFRMPPHLLPRMASPYGGPAYPLRSQPHPFAQGPAGMVFSRPQAVSFGPPENAGFGTQPSYHAAAAAAAAANQALPFRPGPGENFGHMPSQTAGLVPPRDLPVPLGPGHNPAFGGALPEPNHAFASGPNSYGQMKPSPKLVGSKHNAPPLQQQQQQQHPPHGAEEVLSSGSADPKASGPRSTPAGNPEGVLPKHVESLNSTHANGTPNKPRLPHTGPEGIGSEKGDCGGSSKIPPPLPQHGHGPSEPVYPCGICTHEVNDDQDAILCEASCQKWFHRICTGMTESAYGLLTAEASAVWGCDSCMADKDVQLMRTRDMVGPPALNASV